MSPSACASTTRDCVLSCMQAQRKRAMADLQASQQKRDKQIDKLAKQEKKAKHAYNQDLEDLQVQLIQLNNRLLDTDDAVREVGSELLHCQREDEKEIHTTRLVRRGACMRHAAHAGACTRSTVCCCTI